MKTINETGAHAETRRRREGLRINWEESASGACRFGFTNGTLSYYVKPAMLHEGVDLWTVDDAGARKLGGYATTESAMVAAEAGGQTLEAMNLTGAEPTGFPNSEPTLEEVLVQMNRVGVVFLGNLSPDDWVCKCKLRAGGHEVGSLRTKTPIAAAMCCARRVREILRKEAPRANAK